MYGALCDLLTSACRFRLGPNGKLPGEGHPCQTIHVFHRRCSSYCHCRLRGNRLQPADRVPAPAHRIQGGTPTGYAAGSFENHWKGPRSGFGYRCQRAFAPQAPVAEMIAPMFSTGNMSASASLTSALRQVEWQLVYFTTNCYPFYPRCPWERPSSSIRTPNLHFQTK